MDAVIPQGATMPILVDGSNGCKADYNYGYKFNNCMDAGVGATIDMGLSGINNTNRVGDATSASAERAGYANLSAADRAGDRAVNATERSSDKVSEDVHRFGLANLNSTDRNGDRNIDATNYAKDRLENSVNQFGLANLNAIRDGFCDVRREFSKDHADIRREMAVDHGTLRQEICKDHGTLRREMAVDHGVLRHEMAKDHCEIKQEINHGFKDVFIQNEKLAAADVLLQTSNFKDLLINACKDTAALQATAASNHASAQAALAECCCELKGLVREQANATQGLVRDIDRERLRDELANLRAQVLTVGPLAARG